MMKQQIVLILLIVLIGMTNIVLSKDSCKCCFVLTSPTCETRSIDSCLQCTRGWCENNMNWCAGSIPPCFARCNP
jgi:hypothetical protein